MCLLKFKVFTLGNLLPLCLALPAALVACGPTSANSGDGGGGGADGSGGPGADSGPGYIDGGQNNIDPGVLHWSYTHDLVARKGPAIDTTGRIYLHGPRSANSQPDDPTLVVVDKDGALVWSADTTPQAVPAPSVTLHDGTVYVPAQKNMGQGQEFQTRIYRFDMDGNELSSFDLLGPIQEQLSVDKNGVLYIPTIDVHAYQGTTPVWDEPFVLDDIGGGNPARTGSNVAIAADGTLFVGSRATDKNLYAINPNGTLKWRKKWGRSGFGDPDPKGFVDPIATDGNLVVAANMSSVMMVLDTDGELVWSLDASPGPDGVAISDGVVYFGTAGLGTNFLVAATDSDDDGQGDVLWFQEKIAIFKSTPAVSAGGTVYIPNCGTFYAFDANNGGAEVWSHVVNAEKCLDWGAPTIGPDGRVYVSVYDAFAEGDEYGFLLAFEGDDTGPAPGWSQDAGNLANSGSDEQSGGPTSP